MVARRSMLHNDIHKEDTSQQQHHVAKSDCAVAVIVSTEASECCRRHRVKQNVMKPHVPA